MTRYFIRALDEHGDNVAPTQELKVHPDYGGGGEPVRFIQVFFDFPHTDIVDLIEIRDEFGNLQIASTVNLPITVPRGDRLRVAQLYRTRAIAREYDNDEPVRASRTSM